MDFIILGVLVLLTVINIAVLILNIKFSKRDGFDPSAMAEQFRLSREEQANALALALRSQTDMQNTAMGQISDRQNATLGQISERQNASLREMSAAMSERQQLLQSGIEAQQKNLAQSFQNFMMQNNQNFENIRATMEQRLLAMTQQNEKKLEEMRNTVDQKLQKTLDEKLNRSFSLVSQRVEQVYKGLGEMQTLAVGVGDLKKVLAGVKTRGILGEVQLSAILEEIMTAEQYCENVPTKPGSSERVEFCIKLPGDESEHVLLPIDAKFPADVYMEIVDAYERADTTAVAQGQKNLERTIKGFAKDIRTKYVEPPYTTDFAVMFLPTEGLFAEVVRCGISQKIQSEYKVIVAGPTTMAALLSSLQMGFKTLQIKKRSSEVWQVLAAVKSEFENFNKALTSTQNRLRQAQDELESLVGVRSRQIQRKLRGVEIAATSTPAANDLQAVLPEIAE